MQAALARSTIHWGWAILGALAALATLVAAAFGWVAVWSHLLHADTTQAQAEAHARLASPIVAVALAAPVYYAAGRWLRARLRERAPHTALALFGIDTVLGAASLLTSPAPLYPAVMTALAAAVKLFALRRGARA
jgi:hypothetical protein